ncbi:MAG: 50S ribosomal protein L29 [Candidatus Woesearchaeota archaeon]
MKKTELRNLRQADIIERETELRKELIKINAQVAMHTQIKNPGQIRRARRNIARLKTLAKTKKEDVKKA